MVNNMRKGSVGWCGGTEKMKKIRLIEKNGMIEKVNIRAGLRKYIWSLGDHKILFYNFVF